MAKSRSRSRGKSIKTQGKHFRKVVDGIGYTPGAPTGSKNSYRVAMCRASSGWQKAKKELEKEGSYSVDKHIKLAIKYGKGVKRGDPKCVSGKGGRPRKSSSKSRSRSRSRSRSSSKSKKKSKSRSRSRSTCKGKPIKHKRGDTRTKDGVKQKYGCYTVKHRDGGTSKKWGWRAVKSSTTKKRGPGRPKKSSSKKKSTSKKRGPGRPRKPGRPKGS